MILSEIIRLPVLAGGERIGYVVDARFNVPSDDTVVRGEATLVGLIVSRRRSASYIGYERKSVDRPWPIARYLAWRHRKAFLLLWEDIGSIGRGGVEARHGFERHDPALG